MLSNNSSVQNDGPNKEQLIERIAKRAGMIASIRTSMGALSQTHLAIIAEVVDGVPPQVSTDIVLSFASALISNRPLAEIANRADVWASFGSVSPLKISLDSHFEKVKFKSSSPYSSGSDPAMLSGG